MTSRDTLSSEAIKYKIAKAINAIETMFVGVITSVDHVGLRYGVQPVLNRYDEVDKKSIVSAVLVDCPMLSNKCSSFFIRLPYDIGDMVYVGVSKDSIDESIISGEARDNKVLGVSKFRQIDGVILGGVLSEQEQQLPEGNANDFLIQNRKNDDKFVIKADGGIEIVTKTKVTVDSPETDFTGNLNVAGNVSIVGNIAVEGDGTIGSVTTKAGVTLDGHTHKYNPGPGAPTPTGPGEG